MPEAVPLHRRLPVIALAVLLAGATLTVPVHGGSARSPEVDDGCGDASTGPGGSVPRDATDVASLWYDRRPVDRVIEQRLALCASGQAVRLERVGERLGWVTHWEDDRGRAWSIRVWVQGALASSFNYQLCQGDEAAGGTHGEGTAEVDGDALVLEIPNALPETGFETALNRSYVEGGRFPASFDEGPPWSACGLPLEEVHDRAPDEGFGRSFWLGEEPRQTEEEPGPGVRLAAPEPNATVRTGELATYRLVLENAGGEIRNVSLELSGLPRGWSYAFSPNETTLLAHANATSNLTIAVPADAAGGRHRLTVSGTVRDDSLEEVGEVERTLRLDVEETVRRPTLTVARSGDPVPPGGALVHRLRVGNDGNARDAVELSVAGEASGWAQIEPDQVLLDPDASGNVTVTVQVPADAEPGWYEHRVTAASLDDPAARTTVDVVSGVVLDPPTGPLEGGATLPSPALPGVLAALAVAAVACRARRKRR